VREDVCVFCGAAVDAASRVPRIAGRLSRAAVFAGATLTACSSGPAPQHAEPPPPDEHHAVNVDAAPPSDTAVQVFAAPPPDAATPAGTAIVRGTIRFANAEPYAHRTVTLSGGGVRRALRTDAKGQYEIRDLPAGNYTLTLERYEANQGHQPPPPAPMRAVVLVDGKTEIVDVTLAPYVAPAEDRGPCCKPYGAPPARRRVV
jgi:hypothetical protein